MGDLTDSPSGATEVETPKSSLGNSVANGHSPTSRIAVASIRLAIFGVGLAVLIFAGLIIIPPPPSPVIERHIVSILRLCTLSCFGMATVLGIISLLVIRFSSKKLKGSGYAVKTIVLSIVFCSLVFGFEYVVSMGEAVREEHLAARAAEENIRRVGGAIIEYAEAHNGVLPTASHWCDLILECDKNLSKDAFRHLDEPNDLCGFAFNRMLGGLRLADVPGDTVLLFEAKGNWNLTGGIELLEKGETKRNSLILVFLADGTVAEYWFSGVRGRMPRWNP
jgi:hypothetical protein